MAMPSDDTQFEKGSGFLPGKTFTADDAARAEKPVEKPPEPDAAKASAERVAQLEAEKAELQRIATGAARDAEASKNYIRQLTANLQDAAEKHIVQPSGDGVDPKERLRERMSDDPLSVLDEHFRARTAPLVGQFAEQQAKMARELFKQQATGKEYVRDENGKVVSLWDKYGKEVDEFLAEMSPEIRAQADSYDAAMRWVRSKHLDDELAEREAARIAAEKRSFVEGASGGPGRAKEKPVLSDIEKKIAKALEVSEEDYIKYRDQGGPEA